MESFPIRFYLRNVIFVALKVTLASVPIPLVLLLLLDKSILSSLLIIFISICSSLFAVLIIGISTNERNMIKDFILRKKKHIL